MSITQVTKMMQMKVRTSNDKATEKVTNRQKQTLSKPNKANQIRIDERIPR